MRPSPSSTRLADPAFPDPYGPRYIRERSGTPASPGPVGSPSSADRLMRCETPHHRHSEFREDHPRSWSVVQTACASSRPRFAGRRGRTLDLEAGSRTGCHARADPGGAQRCHRRWLSGMDRRAYCCGRPRHLARSALASPRLAARPPTLAASLVASLTGAVSGATYLRPAGSGPGRFDPDQTRDGIGRALRPLAYKVVRSARAVSADEVVEKLGLSSSPA
jgi:hypothetical protein